MSWRTARSLDVLLTEVNAAAPNRSKLSDGSIGDPAHASRTSDHNPNDYGVVRARDFTHDPAGGCDAGKLAEAIRQLGLRGHPALGPGSYVIWDHRIASATQDGAPWDWEPYSGTNPHTKHCHVSVATAAAGYDSTRPWGVMKEDDDMAYTEKQLTQIIRKAVAAEIDPLKKRLAARDARLRALIKRKFKATDADIDALIAELDED